MARASILNICCMCIEHPLYETMSTNFSFTSSMMFKANSLVVFFQMPLFKKIHTPSKIQPIVVAPIPIDVIITWSATYHLYEWAIRWFYVYEYGPCCASTSTHRFTKRSTQGRCTPTCSRHSLHHGDCCAYLLCERNTFSRHSVELINPVCVVFNVHHQSSNEQCRWVGLWTWLVSSTRPLNPKVTSLLFPQHLLLMVMLQRLSTQRMLLTNRRKHSKVLSAKSWERLTR